MALLRIVDSVCPAGNRRRWGRPQQNHPCTGGYSPGSPQLQACDGIDVTDDVFSVSGPRAISLGTHQCIRRCGTDCCTLNGAMAGELLADGAVGARTLISSCCPCIVQFWLITMPLLQ
jgi:hypothetical protein